MVQNPFTIWNEYRSPRISPSGRGRARRRRPAACDHGARRRGGGEPRQDGRRAWPARNRGRERLVALFDHPPREREPRRLLVLARRPGDARRHHRRSYGRCAPPVSPPRSYTAIGKSGPDTPHPAARRCPDPALVGVGRARRGRVRAARSAARAQRLRRLGDGERSLDHARALDAVRRLEPADRRRRRAGRGSSATAVRQARLLSRHRHAHCAALARAVG